MKKQILFVLIFISLGFTSRKPIDDEINAVYSTEPIGHAYGYYAFEGNKVGRYIRNVGTFYREGNYVVKAENSTIVITYTNVAYSKHPFKKSVHENSYEDLKMETFTYTKVEKDGSYIIDGLKLVEEKDTYGVKLDIKSIRKASNIKKSIK